ncbi:hypothetical protein T484DRAFT_1762615 [Baffinella frigidus]|nr:hypothetical protein T484DRAFT_1762615 [Cryptophyta sp. CCMP2293]
MLTMLQKILSCVCHKCGQIMADDSDAKFRAAKRIKHPQIMADDSDAKFRAAKRIKHPQARLATMSNICKTKRQCKHAATDKDESTPDTGCGAPHPTVLRSGLNFKCKHAATDKDELTPDTGCGAPHPTVLRSGLNFKLKFPAATNKDDTAPEESMTGERELFADEALDILRRVTDDDVIIMGLDPRFCRPDWMVH